MKKMSSLFVLLLCICDMASAQTRPVTGTVTDKKGQAIPFASIIVKGTRTGVTADAEGRFITYQNPIVKKLKSHLSYT